MDKFFKDTRSVDDINASYAGKNLGEIMELEKERQDTIQSEVDDAHEKFIKKDRTRMLTVQKLIDYLKTQDPNACILAYEPNSFAYIEQWPSLPNPDICTVAESKAEMRKSLEHWHKDTANAEEKINKEIEKAYRYAEDTDIIIMFN